MPACNVRVHVTQLCVVVYDHTQMCNAYACHEAFFMAESGSVPYFAMVKLNSLGKTPKNGRLLSGHWPLQKTAFLVLITKEIANLS
jgi:hypothetical protein